MDARAYNNLDDNGETIVDKEKVVLMFNWEVNDIRKCALGIYSDNTKELWDSVQDDLKQQLYKHLLHIQQYYSTSIGYDNVSELFILLL